MLSILCSDKPSPMADFPMREWSLRLHILDEDGNERPADVFTKVVYHLHPTFENPTQSQSLKPGCALCALVCLPLLTVDLVANSLHQAALYLYKRGLGRV